MQDEMRIAFKKEVDRWVEEGILVPWKGKIESDGSNPANKTKSDQCWTLRN